MWFAFCRLALLMGALGAAPVGAQQATMSYAQAVARARAVVARMTLEEKISELHGIQTPTLFRYVPGVPRLGIPALQMTNGPAGVGPGGAGPQKRATALPSPLLLAATWDPSLAYEYGRIAGEETRSTGNTLLEGPDVNLARVPQNGRTFEGFGEDPYLDARVAVAEVDGIQSTGVMATVKHYIANNQESNRFGVDEIVGERALRELYMPAFKAAVLEGRSASVMCAYNKVNGAFNCENTPLLGDVLKKEWRYDGFVMSDWGATHSTVASALAGLDLEMPTGRYFNDALQQAVESGKVPMSVIDDKLVRRFAKMMQFGTWGPAPTVTPIPAMAHGAVARSIADQGMVLLKNDGGLLPLGVREYRSIALIGPYAVRPNSGGGGSSHVIPLYTITPYDGLQAALESRITVLDGSDVDAAVADAKRAQIAVVMVGDENSEGRDHPISLPDGQDRLIQAVAKANPKTIVVVKSGSAVLMPWINEVATVIEAWYPGEEDGNAVADVLTGKVDPCGKLPITFPASVDQTPAKEPEQYPGVDGVVRYTEGLDVGYRGYVANHETPLFPFGFGLSYTSFRFEGLKVMHAAGSHDASVSLQVTNTGKVAGAEVAELYLGFPKIAEGNEPPMQLKAFRKIKLNPGETKRVEMKLDEHAFSYWSAGSHGWRVAKGEFEVMVGDSSADTPLRSTITIQ
ncbi:MAG: beta-glucosidase [Acidobacteriaceae bacterium]